MGSMSRQRGYYLLCFSALQHKVLTYAIDGVTPSHATMLIPGTVPPLAQRPQDATEVLLGLRRVVDKAIVPDRALLRQAVGCRARAVKRNVRHTCFLGHSIHVSMLRLRPSTWQLAQPAWIVGQRGPSSTPCTPRVT